VTKPAGGTRILSGIVNFSLAGTILPGLPDNTSTFGLLIRINPVIMNLPVAKSATRPCALNVAISQYQLGGLTLLIALSAKNGILIVEVARELRNVHHKSIVEAAAEASRARFRPSTLRRAERRRVGSALLRQ
jgi:hypothetical protein